jgi:hypothetical protein
LLPSPETRYSLKEDQHAPMASLTVSSPLDDMAYRLTHPAEPVFEVRGDAGVDRWPLVILDRFDGVNWLPSDGYLKLGTELRPGPAVTVDSQLRTAQVRLTDLASPWLPSQTWPASVAGAGPLVEEQNGTLLRQGDQTSYTLSWWEPQATTETLFGAGIDADAAREIGGVGTVPDGMSELAERATRGMRPSMQSALLLEQYLRDNYQLVVEGSLPTGHSWPQLVDFLQMSKRGTSEQFAAAYVALARIRGIPARLAVGFRAPHGRNYTVRNGDVYAWPEVAAEGVGWVQLDPARSGSASGSGAGSGLSAAAAGAREQLPLPQDLRDHPVAPTPDSDTSIGIPWVWLLGVALGLVVLLILGVPVAKAVRAWRRRRRSGQGAVIGAWEEARDRLRAHGLPVTAGMTVRDLATVSPDDRTQESLRRLGATVDVALWSGIPIGAHSGQQAWSAVRDVRRGLACRGWKARILAAFELRTFRPPN